MVKPNTNFVVYHLELRKSKLHSTNDTSYAITVMSFDIQQTVGYCKCARVYYSVQEKKTQQFYCTLQRSSAW